MFPFKSRRSTTPEAVSAAVVEDDRQKHLSIDTANQAPVFDDAEPEVSVPQPLESELNYRALLHEAEGLRTAAIKAGEAYLLRDVEVADIMTIERAVDRYGRVIAQEESIDVGKVAIAGVQINQALGERLAKSGEAGVDEATYILAALSVRRWVESAPDDVTRKEGEFVLRSLGKFVNADMDRLSHVDEYGPHTGELAVAAIMAYGQSEQA